MTATTTEIQEFAEKLIPGDAPGQFAIRAVVADALRQWEVREAEPGRRQTFLPTSDGQLDRINDPSDLEAFRVAYGLRTDWHEPDNSGVTAYVIGDHLDNAMGSGVDHTFGELNVVLTHTQAYDDKLGAIHLPIAVVNLATLLSWATDGHRSAKALTEATAQR